MFLQRVVGVACGLHLLLHTKAKVFAQSQRDLLLSRENIIKDPFNDQELNENLGWRIQSEQKAEQYRNTIAIPYYKKLRERLDSGEINSQQFREELLAVKERVLLDIQIITFANAERNARRKYVYDYGCIKWTESALNIIKELSPVVEIGAGGGQWTHALRERGVNIVAYDNDSSDSPTPTYARKTKVLFGDEKKLGWHPHRSLLIVYPPPSDMAYNCLQYYKGDVIVYVGEGRGGATANSKFFDAVEKDFDCVLIEPVEPFNKCYEKMYVLRRKKPYSKFLFYALAKWLW